MKAHNSDPRRVPALKAWVRGWQIAAKSFAGTQPEVGS